MAGTCTFESMIVALPDGLEMLRIVRCELWIVIGIICIHGFDHTVFQSPGNLGIIAE